MCVCDCGDALLLLLPLVLYTIVHVMLFMAGQALRECVLLYSTLLLLSLSPIDSKDLPCPEHLDE